MTLAAAAMADRIPLIDLAAQRARIGPAIDAAVARVHAHGQYILGPEVAALESALAAFVGAGHCVTCANGTDALVLALKALGIGPGDGVIVPAFTFIATAEAVVLAGGVPVFADVRPATFDLDPSGLGPAIAAARAAGVRARAVIPVDLFGLPADYDAIADAAPGLAIVGDAAQSLGGARSGRSAGTLAPVTTTSFFPTKPLGCYGDGGAIFTDDADAAQVLRSLRSHGAGTSKYDNVRIGTNSRLDTLQAAILLEKLKVLPDELAARRSIAGRYAAGLGNWVGCPVVPEGAESAWALYTVQSDRRAAIAAAAAANGVATAIYYSVPLHCQPAYRGYPRASARLAVAERLGDTVLSLPMHPYLSPDAQDRVIAVVGDAAG